jgi:UDP-N-acetylmuramoylalanine--D-glutamate ligase
MIVDGKPLISVDDRYLDHIVAEVSSYQLESIKDFRPRISMILNITEDHLTRHKTMSEYAKQKSAIFRNQKSSDALIYNMDDARVLKIIKTARCRKLPISQKKIAKDGAYALDGFMYFRGEMVCPIKEMYIKGEHNVENALAAISAAKLCGVATSSIRRTLRTFKGVEHRIEFVKKAAGVSYFNDSKGTNPDSTLVAIKALSPSYGIVLMLGGRDKMTNLKKMCLSIRKNVKEVVLLGEAKERFKKELKKCGIKNIHEAGSFRSAVMAAKNLSKPGDAVLLSPACASFDMFNNYEERGKVFKSIVANL